MHVCVRACVPLDLVRSCLCRPGVNFWDPEVTRCARGSRCPGLEVLKPRRGLSGGGLLGCGHEDAAAVPARAASFRSFSEKSHLLLSLCFFYCPPQPPHTSDSRTL